MKKFRDFIKEAQMTTGFTGSDAASGPVAGYDPFFFPDKGDDLLSQDFQTPGESGLYKWELGSGVYPVEKVTMDNIDDMVQASNEYSDLMYKNTEDVMRKNLSKFMGGR
tara:strand:- start:94 stop:420 length:327 start_codon:yes stop_codon:yes gene_type:complete